MFSQLSGQIGRARTYRYLSILLCIALLAVPLLASVAPAAAGDKPTVSLSSDDKLGTYLVGPNGMTLYTFKKDHQAASVCSDKCVENWPLLTVNDGETPTAGQDLPGKLDVLKRSDGKLQVTYNGQPLYYWVKDKAAGDTTGQDVGHVWYVARPQTITAAQSDKLGTILVSTNGMTLYTFMKDKPGESACYDKCAENWPPLLAASEKDLPDTIGGAPDQVGVIKRTDGKFQVTYNNMPLYTWVKDKVPGDTTGQGVGDVWFVVKPSTLLASKNDKLGNFLINANGMTLYTFKNDKPGESACYDKCAENWPPLLVVESEKPAAANGLSGKLGVIKRTDGKFQVTYNDMPLYTWVKDKAPGDTTGQGVGDVWYIAQP